MAPLHQPISTIPNSLKQGSISWNYTKALLFFSYCPLSPPLHLSQMLGEQITPLLQPQTMYKLIISYRHLFLANTASLWVAGHLHHCGVFQVLFLDFTGIQVRPQVQTALTYVSKRFQENYSNFLIYQTQNQHLSSSQGCSMHLAS